MLKTDIYKGLSGNDFEERDIAFGSNQKDAVKPTSKKVSC
jgi:hypothetical protein